MRRNQAITIWASLITAVGGLTLNGSELAASAEAEGTCVYGYAAYCDDELCGPGYTLTCVEEQCSMPWCEDNRAFSCCI